MAPGSGRAPARPARCGGGVLGWAGLGAAGRPGSLLAGCPPPPAPSCCGSPARGGGEVRAPLYPPRKHIPPRSRQAGRGGVCGAAGKDGKAVPEAGLGARFPPASLRAARQRLIWRGLPAGRPLPGWAGGRGRGWGCPAAPSLPAVPKGCSIPALVQSSPGSTRGDSGESGQTGIPCPSCWQLLPRAVEVTK